MTAEATGFRYLNDGPRIYAESRAIIEAESDLSGVPLPLRELAVRLIHSCGMTDVVDDIDASPGAVTAGRAALEAGAPVLCDVAMTARGIIARLLPRKNRIVCTIGQSEVQCHAERSGTTRSWAAADLWGAVTQGAVVAIGNAPTALFRVLERAPSYRPALVIGMPVGFVGASDAKLALAASGLDYVTVHGRRGGSAMAAAAVNALFGTL